MNQMGKSREVTGPWRNRSARGRQEAHTQIAPTSTDPPTLTRRDAARRGSRSAHGESPWEIVDTWDPTKETPTLTVCWSGRLALDFGVYGLATVACRRRGWWAGEEGGEARVAAMNPAVVHNKFSIEREQIYKMSAKLQTIWPVYSSTLHC